MKKGILIGLLFTITAVLIAFVLKMVATKITNKMIENFEESSLEAQESGASEYYGWGYHPILDKQRKERERRRRKHKKEEKCIDDIVLERKTLCQRMGECPITSHPDIDKYVLRSSIKPCPNMKDYTKKSMLCPSIDMDKYMLKSKCRPKQCPDLSDYIKKSEIRSSPECGIIKEVIRGVPESVVRQRERASYDKGRLEAVQELREERRVRREEKSLIDDIFAPFKKIGSSLKFSESTYSGSSF